MDLRKASSMPDLRGYGFEVDDEFELYKDQIRVCSSQDNLSMAGSALRYRMKIKKIRNKTMLQRLEEAAPYNMFFNTLDNVIETYKQSNSIGFGDLLCPSLGELKCSLHICSVPELEFVIDHYRRRKLITKPMTIVHGGCEVPKNIPAYPNIKLKFIKLDSPFGWHNARVSIFVYEDESLRVVVATVNPMLSDWSRLNQGQWKAKAYNRGTVMPRTRIYCRISKCLTKLAYFFLTGANLTRSGWGRPCADGAVVTRTYEAGVVFIPKFFNETFFKIKDDGNGDQKLFPFLLDLPVTPYTRNDVCWFTAGVVRPEANLNPEQDEQCEE